MVSFRSYDRRRFSRTSQLAAAATLAVGVANAHGQTPRPEGTIAAWGRALARQDNAPPANFRFKQVSAGWLASLGIIDNPGNDPNMPPDGTMWAWGDNGYFPAVNHPPAGMETWRWKRISAGYWHNLAIDEKDQLAAWGSADVDNEYAGNVLPELVEKGVLIRDIEAGENLSVVLTTENQLYFWGRSDAFACSLITTRPTESFVEISAHGHHVLARRTGDGGPNAGKVLPFGPNIDGWPGWDFDNHWYRQNHYVPQIANAFGSFTAGHWHSAALTPTGNWYSQGQSSAGVWGDDSRGQCQPPPDPTITLRVVEGGYFHNVGLTQYGGLIAWGGSIWGALNVPYGRFKMVSSRFDHGLAIAACYANCDGSTTPPVVNVLDYACFLNSYAAGDRSANCDGSTVVPVLDMNDFAWFLNAYATGCGQP